MTNKLDKKLIEELAKLKKTGNTTKLSELYKSLIKQGISLDAVNEICQKPSKYTPYPDTPHICDIQNFNKKKLWGKYFNQF